MKNFYKYGIEVEAALLSGNKEELMQAWERNKLRMKNAAVGHDDLMEAYETLSRRVFEALQQK